MMKLPMCEGAEWYECSRSHKTHKTTCTLEVFGTLDALNQFLCNSGADVILAMAMQEDNESAAIAEWNGRNWDLIVECCLCGDRVPTSITMQGACPDCAAEYELGMY